MSDENELKSFLVSCKIGLSNSTNILERHFPRPGKIEFDATTKTFSTRDYQSWQIVLGVGNIIPLDKKECASGNKIVIDFDFNKPNQPSKYDQMILSDLSEKDKQLIHNCLLKLVGVKTGNLANSIANSANCKSLSKLSENMGNLIEQREQYSDCILVAEGKEFKVYKGILACRSPVFAAMFQNNEMIEAQNGIVQIVDMRSEVLEQMLRFIHTGTKPKMEDIAEDLLIAAEKYELIELKEFCENVLVDSLVHENACELLVLASQNCAKNLKIMAIKFIKMHAKMVIKTEGWKMLLKGNNEDLVDQIVNAIVEWQIY